MSRNYRVGLIVQSSNTTMGGCASSVLAVVGPTPHRAPCAVVRARTRRRRRLHGGESTGSAIKTTKHDLTPEV